MSRITYVSGAELAPTRLWLTSDGTLVDLTSYTVTVTIGRAGSVVLTKTTGLTAGAGSGVEPTGTPNLIIGWAADELALPAWVYDLQVQARSPGGLDYRWLGKLAIRRGYPVP